MIDDAGSIPLQGPGWRARRLTLDDAPLLQAFFDANPGYAELAYGHPWPADEARRELQDLPPADFPQGRTHFLGVEADGGAQPAGPGAPPTGLCGFVSCTDDLLAPGVFHLGFLYVAEAWHGRGLAQALFDALCAWAQRRGAQWLRLGVLDGNARARRFWARQGLQPVRQRAGMAYGAKTHTVHVLVRPFAGGSLADYLARVARDRPESP